MITLVLDIGICPIVLHEHDIGRAILHILESNVQHYLVIVVIGPKVIVTNGTALEKLCCSEDLLLVDHEYLLCTTLKRVSIADLVFHDSLK